MRNFFFASIMIACAASFSLAQNQDEYNMYDVYVGYSHNRVDFGGDREGFNGVEGAVTGNLSRYVGLKADYAFHFKSFGTSPFNVDARTRTLVGGVQIKDNSTETRVKPFLHLMAGLQNARASATGFSDSSTGFAGIVGGGLDIRAGKRVDVRVIQFDYNPTRIEGEWQHNFRIGAGIVIR